MGNNLNINSMSHCNGALLTLSFHAKESDRMKCYLYLNGQMCRFFAEDIFYVLPTFFDMECGSNYAFLEAIYDAIGDNDWNAHTDLMTAFKFA
eukprot:876294_1